MSLSKSQQSAECSYQYGQIQSNVIDIDILDIQYIKLIINMYQIPNIDKLSEYRIFIYDTNILCCYLCKYSTLVAKGTVCIVLIKLHRAGSNLCMILYNA